METDTLVKRLRDKSHASVSVALRQALYYYLDKENIPVSYIADAVGKTKRYIYMSIYRTRDFLEVGDKTTKMCLEEITKHNIRIVPITVDGKILTKHIGYKLVIDNIIV